MSYNIAIAISPIPVNDAEAWVDIHNLRKVEGPRPAAIFQELHDKLTARYPCMCSVPDSEIDHTVWSDGPLINNFGHRVAVLGISYSRAEEVVPFIVTTANAMGFSVFDWATKTIHRA